MRQKVLTAECLFFFGVLPAAAAALGKGKPLVLLLWPAALVCIFAMRRQGRPPALWGRPPSAAAVKTVLLRFAVLAALITGLSAVLLPEHFLSFPRSRPAAWLVVMLLYPAASVYPQNIIYRVFFFHRYGPLFESRNTLIFAAACAFAWTHMAFWNAPALALSLLGGLMFSRTYASSGSAALAFIEHSLYGCLLFTVGPGVFFFHGSVAH